MPMKHFKMKNVPFWRVTDYDHYPAVDIMYMIWYQRFQRTESKH